MDGQNVVIDDRYPAKATDRISDLATALVQRRRPIRSGSRSSVCKFEAATI